MKDKKSMCSCGHILDDHTTIFEIGNNLCANVGCDCSQFRPTKYALDAALVAPAEQLSGSVIVPAGEVDTQPRQ